ncbi:hypothetical protein ALC60_13353 [Trachymyrmex zeteki]|uniref:Chitin-binding type-4 domain-containing protein n=1 Tax=Mycetomoellerius zeteki TaxID=64791 RepID=A0A151WIC9_9HYME|nr:PREDICTED: uncharacterized protein LOC108729687 [Trachymyrmex zeteki]KYQ47597.1 hypothetical protein ALC60_13353 [Trachymyrmex zeteki]
MAFMKLFVLTLVTVINLQEIYGHGLMNDPVNRSSAWRKNLLVEPNYTDYELFCGGYSVQYGKNRGKCGECGDDYALPRPRPNENGGIYGSGIIVQKYKAGSIINATVYLTETHLGYFEFSLCPLKNKKLETEKCFNTYPLPMADGKGYKYPITSNYPEDYTISLVLPKNVTCKQCVIRWNYRTGDNWGTCEDGTQAVGCGPQETFRNCADVTITN